MSSCPPHLFAGFATEPGVPLRCGSCGRTRAEIRAEQAGLPTGGIFTAGERVPDPPGAPWREETTGACSCGPRPFRLAELAGAGLELATCEACGQRRHGHLLARGIFRLAELERDHDARGVGPVERWRLWFELPSGYVSDGRAFGRKDLEALRQLLNDLPPPVP